MEKLKIACLIPAFNEESTIARVVGFIPESFDVFVIDDASTDHTRSMLSPQEQVICNQSNLVTARRLKNRLDIWQHIIMIIFVHSSLMVSILENISDFGKLFD